MALWATAAAASSEQFAGSPGGGLEAFQRQNSGTDSASVADTGKRQLGHSGHSSTPVQTTPCGESCEYSTDGRCDDGGEGSVHATFTRLTFPPFSRDAGARTSNRHHHGEPVTVPQKAFSFSGLRISCSAVNGAALDDSDAERTGMATASG
eukprot:4225433-Prymnesium_polylepis.1